MRRLCLVLLLLVVLELCVAGSRWKSERGDWGRRKNRRRSRGQVTGAKPSDARDETPGRHRQRGSAMRHHGSRHRWAFGPPRDPWFSLDVSDFSAPTPRNDPWWSGPNVCYSENRDDQNTTKEISHHITMQSLVCDGSDTTFRCTKELSTPEGKRTVTELYECCPGFTRTPYDFGCPDEVELIDLPTVLETLKLEELTNLLDSTGLSKEVFTSNNNFTIFAPNDEALKSFTASVPTVDISLQDDPNVIMVSKNIEEALMDDTRNLLLGHVVVGRYTTPLLTDNTVIESASPYKTTIRINTYQSPIKLTMANCKKLTSVDNVASDGVVHVVDGVLEPVTRSLLDIVSKNPELSTLKTALGSSDFGSLLREDGQYTVLAPTDAAFKQHANLMKKIVADPKCLNNVLKNHLFPHVICSSVIQGQVRSANMLDRYANLTRDSDDKVYIDGSQVVSADIMATNGILHIIDSVLIPDDALGLLDLVEKQELSEFAKLVDLAGLKKTISNLDNVTLFVPSNEAVKALPSEVVTSLASDPKALESILKYHVVPGAQSCGRFYNDLELDTMSGGKLRINEYSNFPLGRHWTRTAQCAQFDSMAVRGCNGMMYVIDKVLTPPMGNVVDVLALDSRFSSLVELLKQADLADALQEDGPFTVFAPTNKAFEDLGSDVVEELKQNKNLLKATLKNHVTRDAICCAGILRVNWMNTQRVRTLSDAIFDIGKTRSGTKYIGEAEITDCDKSATNGVVHVIDSVILTPRRRRDPFWDMFHW